MDKQSFRNKLDTLSNQIAEIISARLRSLDLGDRVLNISLKPFPAIIEQGIEYLTVDIQSKVMQSPYLLSGFAEENHINIKFDYSNLYNSHHWNDMYMDLIEIIRHEIEHSDQIKPVVYAPKMIDNYKQHSNIRSRVNDYTKYMLQNHETDAFLRGLLMKAKKSGRDANDLVRETVKWFFFPNMSEIAIEIYFGDDHVLRNGMTIHESYSKIIELYEYRLKDIVRGEIPSI